MAATSSLTEFLVFCVAQLQLVEVSRRIEYWQTPERYPASVIDDQSALRPVIGDQ